MTLALAVPMRHPCTSLLPPDGPFSQDFTEVKSNAEDALSLAADLLPQLEEAEEHAKLLTEHSQTAFRCSGLYASSFLLLSMPSFHSETRSSRLQLENLRHRYLACRAI